MTAIWINSIGIVLAISGTILTLWTTFVTKAETAGTWGELADRPKTFPKEKRRVVLGCLLIALGGVFQIISQFFH